MPGLQGHGLSCREPAGTAGPQNLSRPMQGLRWQGQDYRRQLRRLRLALCYREACPNFSRFVTGITAARHVYSCCRVAVERSAPSTNRRIQ